MKPKNAISDRIVASLMLGGALLGAAAMLGLSPGCTSPQKDQAERLPYGYMWYLDGAGGGSALRNYGGGLKKGMLAAGYQGGGEIFGWNTGMGVTADQLADNNYKRGKARKLADEIQDYKKRFPAAPVNLVGLSAGTAITVFTLEALPAGTKVDNVVLLGASISATHDLSKALQRVSGQMFVFTSEKDGVLRFAVSVAGTADRSGTQAAGLRGFRLPRGASSQTRQIYRDKLSEVPWRQEFARKGNYGGHTDTVNARFVQAYIAPLLMKGAPERAKVAAASHHVDNPDFGRSTKFRVGSWVKFEGQQVQGGQRHRLIVTERLAERQDDQLVVERIYEFPDGGDHEKRQFYIHHLIDPNEHPMTHKGAKVVEGPKESLRVKGQAYSCDVFSITSQGGYAEWGLNPSGKVYFNAEVPGGLMKIELEATSEQGAFEVLGEVMDFKVVK